MTDRDLLTSYLQTHSPTLFAQLVSRHINLVYSVARRHVKDPHLAEDITQEVFLTLAKKAHALTPDIPLAGWLFTTTRLLSLQSRRAASRRSHHETEAAMSQEPPPTPDPTWPLIAQDIDQAVADLPPSDRDALLLRFFTGQSHPEIAATLAISEEAAKKRVQRALDALQKILTARGLAPTNALSLAAALSAHAVQAAPPALATSITSAITTKTALTLTTKGTLMATAKLKTILIAAAALAAVTITITAKVYFATPPVHAPSPVSTSESSATTSAAAPQSPPLDSEPTPIDYRAAYALPPKQAIANFPNVEPAARAAIYQEQAPAQYQSNPKTPGAIIIQNAFNQLSIWGTSSIDSFPLKVIVARILDIYSPEMESPFPLPTVTGDIVFRSNATPDQYLLGLQTILSDHFKRPITCSFRTEPTDIILLSGTYHLSPPPNAPANPNGDSISFYLRTFDPTGSTGGGSGTPRILAGFLSELISQPVIIESPTFPKRLHYNTSRDASHPLSSPEDIALLLQHISEQTGLTVTHENRPIRRLIIEYATPTQTPSASTVEPWKGWGIGNYPTTSPFQAVRWNGDNPEVQIDDTWYQLLSLDNLTADQIVAAAKSADREWQRRFEEDLPALLAYMNHPTGDTVSLQLKNLQTQKTESLPAAPLTQENRSAIMRARHPQPTP